MRETWIKEIKSHPVWSQKISIIFVSAFSPYQRRGRYIKKSLMKESKNNEDLLIFNQEDSYRLFTLKVLNYLHFVVENVENFRKRWDKEEKVDPIIVKMTDDVVVYPRNFINILKSIDNSRTSFGMGGEARGFIYDFYRNPNHKHYVPYYIYSKAVIDGEYAAGICYFMSYSAAKQIFEYSKCLTALLFQDDAIITGFLRKKLGISLSHIEGIQHASTVYQKNSTAVMHGYPSMRLIDQSIFWNSADKDPLE